MWGYKMLVIAFFTDKGAPKTGLTPTIDIWKSDGTQIVNGDTMTEIGGGFYKYDFQSYIEGETYCIRADGGASLSNTDRYMFGTNEIESSDEIIRDKLKRHDSKMTAFKFI